MAEVANGYVSLIPQMDGVKKEVERALGGTNFSAAGAKSGKGFVSGLGSTLKGATKILGGAVVAAGALVGGLALKGGFDRALAIEGAEAKLQGLGHSAESVEQIMTNALGAVRGTAFGMGEAATVAASAVAAGIKPGDDLQRMLTLVGDAATIAGTDMGSMGAIFNKVAASNKVQMDVINQLHDAGVPALALLADQMGVTAEEASKMASAGKVDFETFQAAIEQGMGGAALKSGETFNGALANTRAALGRLGLLAAGPIKDSLKGIFNDAIPAIDSVTAGLTPLMEDLAAKLSPIVADISGKFFDWIANSDMSGMLTQVMNLVTLFSPLGLAFKSLQPLLPQIAALLSEIGTVLGGALAAAIPLITELAMALFPVLAEVIGAVLPVLAQLAATLMPALVKILASVTPLLITVGEVFGAVLVTALNALLPLFMQIVQGVLPIVLQLVQMLLPVLMQVVQAILPAFSAIMQTLMPILSSLVQALLPVLASLVTALAPILAAVVPIFTMIVEAIAPLISLIGALLIPIIEALMPVVEVVFGAILDVISGAMQMIQGVIAVVTGIISGDWQQVWDGIKTFFAGLWNTIKALVVGAINSVKTAISSTLETIKTVWNTAWDNVSTALSDVWEGIKTAVTDAVDAVLTPIKDFKDDVINFFLNAKDWLVDSGKALINGFKDGITGAFDQAKDAVSSGLSAIRNFFPFSPAKTGPFSGRGWVDRSGASLMTAFAGGIRTSTPAAVAAADAAMEQVSEAILEGDAAGAGQAALASLSTLTGELSALPSELSTAANQAFETGNLIGAALAQGLTAQTGPVSDAAALLAMALITALHDLTKHFAAAADPGGALEDAAIAAVVEVFGDNPPPPPGPDPGWDPPGSDPEGSGLSRDDLDYLADRIIDGLSELAVGAGRSTELIGGARRLGRQLGGV